MIRSLRECYNMSQLNIKHDKLDTKGVLIFQTTKVCRRKVVELKI